MGWKGSPAPGLKRFRVGDPGRSAGRKYRVNPVPGLGPARQFVRLSSFSKALSRTDRNSPLGLEP